MIHVETEIERLARERARRPGAKKAEAYPCPACYRPVTQRGAYCEGCVERGVAEWHRRGRVEAATAAAREATSPPPERPAVPKPPIPKRAPTPAAQTPERAIEPRVLTVEQRARKATRERARRRVWTEEQLAAKRKRDRGDQTDPRSRGARTRTGAPVSEQAPARDAALRLMDTPDEPGLLHVYGSRKRAKAAVWYLRHRVNLPDDHFTFWQAGEEVYGVYAPSGWPRPAPPPPEPAPEPILTAVCRCGNSFTQPARGRRRKWCYTCRPARHGQTGRSDAERALIAYLRHEGPSDGWELLAYADEMVRWTLPLLEVSCCLWYLEATGEVRFLDYGPDPECQLVT